MSPRSSDYVDVILDDSSSIRLEGLLRAAIQQLDDSADSVRRVLEIQGLLMREHLQLKQLLRALVEKLSGSGTLSRTELVHHLVANAEQGHPSDAHEVPAAPAYDVASASPYRDRPPSPRPGWIACARCGKEIPSDEAFVSADGRFCGPCF